jgi:glycosyltransferase involved in cell wall biosynthesis
MPKIAVIHDWLVTYAGAERVLEQILECFPAAEIYSVVCSLQKSERSFIKNKSVHTSFIQSLPFAQTKYRSYLPLMPLAVEQFDLSPYDIIISSSHAVAKGVITGPDQLHISYVHSPMRYAWDLQHQCLEQANFCFFTSYMARYILHKMRMWDARTGNGVDYFLANSRYIARRIRKVYGKDSRVMYPPVALDRFRPVSVRKDFDYFVTYSRFVPYKMIDHIAAAFRSLPYPLTIIGTGPDFKKVQSASGSNVTLLGFQPDDVLLARLQQATAFVFMAEEDFGIACVEAQACGIPVIAYGKGGSLETIQGVWAGDPWPTGYVPTGVWFREQTSESLADAVRYFQANRHRFSSEACRKNALRFSEERFRTEFKDFVLEKWVQFQKEIGPACLGEGV